MEQFEQLLTCAICLDRYRNPKLLPCQHSFCMEPCMDGLVDYVRRQVITLFYNYITFIFTIQSFQYRTVTIIKYLLTGKMSGMSSGTSNTVQWCSRISNKCNSTAFLGTPYRNYWRVTRSNEWTNNETLWCMFRKSIRDIMRSLRKRSMFGLQRRSYGYFKKRNSPN